MRSSRFALVALALVASIVLSACSAFGGASGPPKQSLTITMGALPKTGDANFDTSLFASPVYRIIYDTLVEQDTGKPEPAVAESWSQRDDLTWEFKIRKGVKFQNGEAVDAAAVKWNIDRTRNPDTKSHWGQRFALIEQVEVVDESTVRVKTSKPFATLLGNLVKLVLIPPKYFQEKGQEEFNRAPIGTGPFKVVEWKQDDTITLDANKEYWRGAPTIERLTFKLMAEASARVASLEAGESQILYALPPEQAQRLKDKGLNVVSNPIAHSYIIVLRNALDSPIKDVKVRQAMNHAIDKDAIINDLLAGFGRKLEGQIVGPDALGYNPNIKAFEYDPEKAKRLLAEAGYPNGFTVKFQSSAGRYIKDKEVNEAVVNQLAKVGIKVEMEILESGVWLDKWMNAAYTPMFNVAILYGPFMDIEAALPSFTSGGPTKAYMNPEMDELYLQQATAVDPQKRAAVLKQITEHMYNNAAALYLFQVPNVAATSKNVNNLEFRADYSVKDILKLSVGQ